MLSPIRLLLLLFLVVLSLSIGWIINISSDTTRGLHSLTYSQVTKVVLASSSEPIVLERASLVPDSWIIKEIDRFADEKLVLNLINSLNHLKIEPLNISYMAEKDASRFGFNSPQGAIEILTNAKSEKILFGKRNELSRNQYLLLEDEQRVFLTQADFAQLFSKKAKDFVKSSYLLPVSLDQLKCVEVSKGNSTVVRIEKSPDRSSWIVNGEAGDMLFVASYIRDLLSLKGELAPDTATWRISDVNTLVLNVETVADETTKVHLFYESVSNLLTAKVLGSPEIYVLSQEMWRRIQPRVESLLSIPRVVGELSSIDNK